MKIETNLRVEIADDDKSVLAVSFLGEEFRIKYDTEEDAKRTDALCTALVKLLVAMFVELGAEHKEMKIWAAGEKP